MEFEDQEEGHWDVAGSGPDYNVSLRNSDPTKMPSPAEEGPLRRPRYRECQKNQAVGIGGHAVDGCGEFMPAGDDGTLESLRCGACDCHRNFHRKENGGDGAPRPLRQYHPLRHPLLAHHPPVGYLQVAPPQTMPAPLQLDLPSSHGGGGSSKRFRTKFTEDQKEKMLGLAERLDWKIQKQDEEIVKEFCREVGVSRQVLRVWMHNNKHNLGKKT